MNKGLRFEKMAQEEAAWSLPEWDAAVERFSGKLFTNNHSCRASGSDARLQKIFCFELQLSNSSTVGNEPWTRVIGISNLARAAQETHSVSPCDGSPESLSVKRQHQPPRSSSRGGEELPPCHWAPLGFPGNPPFPFLDPKFTPIIFPQHDSLLVSPGCLEACIFMGGPCASPPTRQPSPLLPLSYPSCESRRQGGAGQ